MAERESLIAARDYGPGCSRHEGDPHNLCEACWALEPDPKPLLDRFPVVVVEPQAYGGVRFVR